MTKKVKIISVIIVVLLVAVITVISLVWGRNQDNQVLRRIKNDQKLVEIYNKIKDYQTKPQEADILIAEGFNWKSLAELTKDQYFFKQALFVYDLGAQKFGEQNVLFYWNAGKVAESMGRFDLAENYYKEALRIAPSYADGYQNLADLYQYKFKKDPAEIVKIYDDGLKASTGNAALFLNKCSYLRQISWNKEALECYKILVQQYPANQGYKKIVQELEAKVN